MRFENLPSDIRVKLEERSGRELWKRVEEEGISGFAEKHGFSPGDLYNWRSKDVFVPKRLVELVLDEPGISQLKGKGRSIPIENPVFPLPENPELLTRIQESVSVNREGVPVYRTQERSLLERFRSLLGNLGEIPVSVYSRSGYELRYPKYVHEILQGMSFEEDFGALVDESGQVENGFLEAGGKKVPVEEFDGELYSRDKKLELAIERNDTETVEKLIGEEVRRVSQMFRN